MNSANSRLPTPGRQVSLTWNLRQVMASAGMFKTTDLVEPLAARGINISKQMIYKVVTGTPQRINIDLLAALCDILDCTPNELLELKHDQSRCPMLPAELRVSVISGRFALRSGVQRDYDEPVC